MQRLKHKPADDTGESHSFPHHCVVECQGHASNEKTVLVKYLYVERLSESVKVHVHFGRSAQAYLLEDSHRRDPRLCVEHRFAHFLLHVDLNRVGSVSWNELKSDC